jgi:hypothetical protein
MPRKPAVPNFCSLKYARQPLCSGHSTLIGHPGADLAAGTETILVPHSLEVLAET